MSELTRESLSIGSLLADLNRVPLYLHAAAEKTVQDLRAQVAERLHGCPPSAIEAAQAEAERVWRRGNLIATSADRGVASVVRP